MRMGSCVECSCWCMVNGNGKCVMCEEDVRERRLDEENSGFKEWLEKVGGMDVEMVSVERIKW